MTICRECEFYSEDDLTGLSPQDKLDHVENVNFIQKMI